MKICYVYQDQYPWDVRVEKITDALAEAGMEVHIVCRNRTGVPSRERIADGIHVHRVAQGLEPFSRTLLNFPAFWSPTWIRKTVSVVREVGADLIIVRDLPLGPMAYWVGQRTATPVVMDMAENYPAMIQDVWTFRGPRPLDYLIRNPSLLRRIERWLFPRLDGFLVVSEPSGARVRRLAGSRTPIFIVGNTVRLEPGAEGLSHPLVDRLRGRPGLALLYVGGLEEVRGLDTVIRALPEVARKLEEFLFVIVGQGSSEERLRELARDVGVEKNVLFAGWLDHRFVPGVIAESDLCIVPHYVTEHTDTTLPNKLYDYMRQSKPVIVTQAQSLRRIVESRRCGIVYPDKDPAALARAILALVNPGARKVLGEAGRRAIQQEYNWERDKEILVNAVRVMAGRGERNAKPSEAEEPLKAMESLR